MKFNEVRLTRKRRSGFTLIEIVLVLALASLLLVIVFLAVQGAQKARRDYQRKEDLSRTMAAILAWTADHKGQVPLTQSDMNDVRDNYIKNAYDPLLGAQYTLTFRPIGSPHSDVPPVGTVYYQQAHWCNRGPNADTANPSFPIAGDDVSTAKFVVTTGLEAGGQASGVEYCLDNSQ